jgi:hypothetical protein
VGVQWEFLTGLEGHHMVLFRLQVWSDLRRYIAQTCNLYVDKCKPSNGESLLNFGSNTRVIRKFKSEKLCIDGFLIADVNSQHLCCRYVLYVSLWQLLLQQSFACNCGHWLFGCNCLQPDSSCTIGVWAFPAVVWVQDTSLIGGLALRMVLGRVTWYFQVKLPYSTPRWSVIIPSIASGYCFVCSRNTFTCQS